MTKQRVAYTIPVPYGEVLKIKTSANAWWMDQARASNLIAAFSIAATTAEACAHAGITLRQYKYFVEVHPEFICVRNAFRVSINIKAQMTIIQALHKGDIRTSRWWLTKKMPEEFGYPSQKSRYLQKAKERAPSNLGDPELRALTKEYEDKFRAILEGRISEGK